MGDLSPNFSRWEFRCNCGCGFNTVDYELIIVLEALRKAFNDQPITINSGCRCYTYNFSQKINGGKYSRHITGKAADIVITNTSPKKVSEYLRQKYPGKYGIGQYKSFTHIDVRTKSARWFE